MAFIMVMIKPLVSLTIWR